MSRHMKIWSTLAAMAVVLVAACSGDGPTSLRVAMDVISANASVAPVTTSGNPTCATTQGGQGGLGYLAGQRWNTGAASQTYTLNVADLGTITFTTNGKYNGLTSWTSTFPIDAVVMKGGNQGANVYRYPTGATTDNDLTTPKNLNAQGKETGDYAGISHIDFCWYGRFTPVVSTPTPTYERDYQWALAKAVEATSPTSITTGSPVTINYTVTATRTTEGDSKFTIGGTITVRNPAGYAASGTISSVKVQVDAGTPVDATCGTLPTAIPTNGTLTCTYTFENVPNASAGSTHTVKATVSGSGTYATTTTATAGVTFGEPTSTVDASATLADNQHRFSGPNGTIVVASADLTNGTTTFPYDVTYNGPEANTRFTKCGGDAYTVTNTATLTTATDAALTKTVEYKFDVTGCTPVIAVTGTPTWARDYDWTIDKTVEAGSTTTMTTGSTATINYKVALTPTAKETYQLTGTVTVSNPSANGYGPYTPMGVVSVDVPGAIGTPAVTCTSQPTPVNEDGSFSCEYTATVPDKDTRDVTASITKPAGSFWEAATSSPTSVTFPGSPNDTFDETVIVTDDRYTFPGTTGTVTAATSGTIIPLTYSITRNPTVCGSYTVDNTAKFETNDNKETGSDNASHTYTVTACQLQVAVTGTPTFTRDYDWTITKSVTSAGTSTTVTKGSAAVVGYQVAVNNSFTDGGYTIGGTVTVTNPSAGKFGANTSAARVVVSISGVTGTPTLTCDPTTTSPLAEGAAYACTYAASVPNADPRTVTASVTESSAFWTAPANATASVTFGTPTTTLDATATVSDTKYAGFANGGALTGPATFTYDVDWGTFNSVCGSYTVTNTASVTNGNGPARTATANRTISVTGCTEPPPSVNVDGQTAFAYASGGTPLNSLPGGSNRWGWTIPLTGPGTTSYDVYAGAGNNDLAKGTKVGTVTITYANGTVTHSFAAVPGLQSAIKSTHVYAGKSPAPCQRGTATAGNNWTCTSYTVAPGQLKVGTGLSGNIWVIYHLAF